MTQWPPAYMADLPTTNYGMWDAPDPALHPDGSVTPGEGGVDLSVPIGTPVYALASGPIIAAGYWQDDAHGVITQRVNVPGAGPQDLYYQHIQLDSSIAQCQGNCNQYVQRGQLIGTIGPFNEIEMGFNALWGGVWGTGHPGPWVKDPRPWLTSLLNGSPSPYTGGSTGSNPIDPLGAVNSFFGSLGGLLDWLKNPVRLIKMLAGIMLIGIALVLLVAPSYGEAFHKALSTAKKHPEMFA